MFSRYLVIALAIAAAVLRMQQGAWIEASGLTGLAGGLIALRLAPQRPLLKRVAWFGFAVTAISLVALLVQHTRAR